MAAYAEKLTALLADIDQKVDELAALRPFKPEYEDLLWQKLRLEWNYNSNHIEGNTLTYGETQLLIIFGKTTGGHEFREYSEMKAHDTAVFKVREIATEEGRPLSEADIRALNEIILVEPFWKEAETASGHPTRKEVIPGQYKTTPNNVRLKTGETFYFSSPEETPAKMQELIEWYRTQEHQVHPVVLAAELHYRFVRIHPFDDGNGRVARLLMNYHLLRKGYPPIVIKSVDKSNYLTALELADSGDSQAFVTYVGKQILWSLDLSIKAGKGESVEETGDWGKQIDLLAHDAKSKKSHLRQQKETQLEALATWLSINYPIIWKEFHSLFQPFDKFFRIAECNAYFHFANSEVVSQINYPHEDWFLRAVQILDGTYESFMDFSFYFKGGMYFDDTVDIEPVSVKLYIYKSSGSIVVGNQNWNFYSLSTIDPSELYPMKEIAEVFRKKIEASIN